ncbi:c-type cytochrome [Zeimonas arvi]|uniref:Cytochrome c n=1 Tax=Zeimonas arvi TaxID=2498847 RepID=A0A5C8P3H8_9BURK|nr:cytochrome c [Zeimonas arvi]TXL68201.1 cytochrome c [Zeimonas arvi]
MSTREGFIGATIVAAVLLAGCAGTGQHIAANGGKPFGIGRAPSAEELRGWDIDVSPDGTGLPAGSGTVAQGKAIYAQKCAACHGANGEGKPADRLVGGKGTLATDKPVRTVGSYWPYAPTLFDYVRRAMPHDQPQSLSANEVYALAAWLLHANGIVSADATMDARSLPAVRMPNRDGFRPGPMKADFIAERCMTDCK